MKKIIIAIALAFFIFLPTASVYAGTHTQESVNPDQGTQYKIKRAKEKIGLFLRFSAASKADYLSSLTSKRFNELIYILEKKSMNYLETATQRYETTAGQLTELVLGAKLTDKKEGVVNLFSSHIPEIEKVQNNYEYNTAEWRFIQNDINSLNNFSSSLR